MAATTKQAVQKQSSKERLWDTLETAYGQQRQESNEAYDKAYAQTGREMLKRGMQRSSYGAATQANVLSEKNKAADKIYENQIAAYQSGLNTLEQQEKDEAYRNKQLSLQQSQLAEQKRQFNENLAYQREQAELNRAYQTAEREAAQGYQTSERLGTQEYQSGESALNRAFTTSERLGTQSYQSGENALNRAFTTSEREATQKYNTGEREATQAYNTAERIAQQIYNTGEREAQQAWQAGQTAQQQAWQSGENALNRAQDQAQFEIQQAFNEKQWEAQQEQWKEQFEYTKMSDSQKLAYNYIVAAAANGGDVSDALLNQAGISRQDYNAMKAQATTASGSPGPSPNPPPGNPPPTEGDGDKTFLANFTSLGNGIYKGTAPTTNTKVPISSNSNKTGNVKTNTVVYIPEQDKYVTVDDKTGKRSTADKKQVTWKSTLTK